MREEYGAAAFKEGCPVCKELCCCYSKSLTCTRINHCYRRCPVTKLCNQKQDKSHKSKLFATETDTDELEGSRGHMDRNYSDLLLPPPMKQRINISHLENIFPNPNTSLLSNNNQQFQTLLGGPFNPYNYTVPNGFQEYMMSGPAGYLTGAVPPLLGGHNMSASMPLHAGQVQPVFNFPMSPYFMGPSIGYPGVPGHGMPIMMNSFGWPNDMSQQLQPMYLQSAQLPMSSQVRSSFDNNGFNTKAHLS